MWGNQGFISTATRIAARWLSKVVIAEKIQPGTPIKVRIFRTAPAKMATGNETGSSMHGNKLQLSGTMFGFPKQTRR